MGLFSRRREKEEDHTYTGKGRRVPKNTFKQINLSHVFRAFLCNHLQKSYQKVENALTLNLTNSLSVDISLKLLFPKLVATLRLLIYWIGILLNYLNFMSIQLLWTTFSYSLLIRCILRRTCHDPLQNRQCPCMRRAEGRKSGGNGLMGAGERGGGGGRAKFRKRKEGGGLFLFLVSFLLLLPGLERRRKGGFFSCCVSTGQEKSRGLTANWYSEPWNVSTDAGFKHFSSLAFLSLGFKSWKGMFVSIYMRRNALPVLPFLCFPFNAERSISQIRNVLRICSILAPLNFPASF